MNCTGHMHKAKRGKKCFPFKVWHALNAFLKDRRKIMH